MLRCPTISALVCYLGRCALENTHKLATATYGCETVYGDTDSVFLDFTPKIGPPASMEMIFNLGRKAAKFLTYELFRKNNPNSPMELEFEKVYHPFLLYSKKRYEGKKFEIHQIKTAEKKAELVKELSPEQLDDVVVIGEGSHNAKGVITNRRDGVKIAKELYAQVTSHILEGGDVESAVGFVKTTVSRIRNNMVRDYKMFSRTQRVNALESYQDPTSQAAVVVSQRIRDRGEEVPPGTAISYVYLDERDIQPLPPLWTLTDKQNLQPLHERPKAHRAEEAEYAQKTGLRVDKVNYIDAVESAMSKVFSLFPEDFQERIKDIYVNAKHLHRLTVAKSVVGTNGLDNHSALLVKDGMCPWGGTDKEPKPLGRQTLASKYLKGIVTKEVNNFKKYLKEKENMTNDQLKYSFGPDAKQVWYNKAVIELVGSSTYCPVHKRIHNRTLRNPSNVMHRLRISSSGIRFHCKKGGPEPSSWPAVKFYGSTDRHMPLKNAELRQILKEVNDKLAKLKHTAEVATTQANPANTQDVPEDPSTIPKSNSISPTNTDEKCLEIQQKALKRKRAEEELRTGQGSNKASCIDMSL